MTKTSNLKSRLPGQKQADTNIDTFIAGAETRITDNLVANFPWQEPGIRTDVTKIYNLRLPEPYLIKLKYIAEHTPNSMQKFCLDVVVNAIDDKIHELTK